MSSWASAVSFPGRPGPFENLGPVTDYTGQVPWEPLDESLLGRPLAEAIRRDPYPLPAIADREGYHGERHYDHWLSGLLDYALVRRRLADHDLPLNVADPVLDFGCASGRVLRHFLCQADGLDVWGADINQRNVDWVRRFLPPPVHAFQCSALPHLPLEDRSFALVCAFSVFTHIDEFELAWLLELRRILRPGGVAYITLHTDHTWSIMGPKIPLYHALLRLAPLAPQLNITPGMFAGPMPSERMVFAPRSAQPYNANLFFTVDYVRSTWGRYFDIVEHYPGGSGYQDVVLLRKR